MVKYIRTHWRGEHGLLWGLVVNGITGYFILIGVLIGIDWIFSIKLPILLGVVWLLLFLIWAGVGLVRSAIANLKDSTTAFHQRVLACGVMLVVSIAFLATTRDSYMLYLSLAG